ncbi:MAG: type I restriction enzyme HsdR N-terminal domain-containing protein [Chitinophagales bacterium]|nr:type I restriction enzyme HsdR N-terminal domain-containing protein [Chitinophagales bacterium]MCZ2394710.1 type I restriction enzyme HsdR N-terminal domain-containing protein [Chitinophagales bacterium]
MESLFFKTKIIDNKNKIFDPIRKKNVVLTPEEGVRQQILSYMVEQKQYPISYIAVEKQLVYMGKNKRFDIVVYDQSHKPLILIECKQPKVDLSQKTLEQASLYNLVLKVPYLVITNGRQHFVALIQIDTGEYQWLNDLPDAGAIWFGDK